MRYLFVILSLLLCGSCCKLFCEDDRLILQLKGFPPAAIDTVLIARYAAGDAFRHVIDSMYYYPLSNGADTAAILIVIDSVFNDTREYAVRLSGGSKIWQVNHIQFSSAKCPCGGGHYRSISSCTVDGVQQTEKPFQIQP